MYTKQNNENILHKEKKNNLSYIILKRYEIYIIFAQIKKI